MPRLEEEAVELAAHTRLASLASRLDSATVQQSRTTRGRIEEWRALNDRYVRGKVPGSAEAEQLRAQAARYRADPDGATRSDRSGRLA